MVVLMAAFAQCAGNRRRLGAGSKFVCILRVALTRVREIQRISRNYFDTCCVVLSTRERKGLAGYVETLRTQTSSCPGRRER